MALPLLLPLLGIGAGAGAGAARNRQRQEAAQAAADQRRTDAGNLMTVMGQAGPQAGMDPAQQQAQFGLLQSEDPLMRQLAIQQMMPQDPVAAAQALANLEKTRTETAGLQQDQDIAATNQPLDMMQQLAEIANLEARTNQLNQPPAMDPTAPRTVPNPYTGFPTVAAPRGTQQFNNLQIQSDASANSLRDINRMLELTALYGTERWNDEAVGQMQATHRNVISRLAADAGAGALGDQERDFWLGGVPDPTSWSAQMTPGRQARIVAAYTELARRISRQYEQRLSLNPLQISNLELMHPDIMPPAKKAYLEANLPWIE